MTRHPRACHAPGCGRLCPRYAALCLTCQYGGRPPRFLGAFAWREAAKAALSVVAAAIYQPGDLNPPLRRPSAAEMQRALRRIARCHRGATYATKQGAS